MVAWERKAEFECQRDQTAGFFNEEGRGGRLFCSVLAGGAMRRYVKLQITIVHEMRGFLEV